MIIEGVYIEFSEERGQAEWSINMMDKQMLELVKNGLQRELQAVNRRIDNRSKLIGSANNPEILKKLAIEKEKINTLIIRITNELQKDVVKR